MTRAKVESAKCIRAGIIAMLNISFFLQNIVNFYKWSDNFLLRFLHQECDCNGQQEKTFKHSLNFNTKESQSRMMWHFQFLFMLWLIPVR